MVHPKNEKLTGPGSSLKMINRRHFLALLSSGILGAVLSSCDALQPSTGVASVIPRADASATPQAEASVTPRTEASIIPRAETSASWQKYQDNPVLGGNLGTCFDVALLKEGNSYRMWFSWRPKQSIALVESQDGIHWNDPIIVLGPNPDSHWEDLVNRPVVVKIGDGYHMWYTGQANNGSCIGYATSPDGLKWERRSNEPVLRPSTKWEGVAAMCPHVIYEEKSQLFRMWYSAGENYEPNAIGYATSSDGLHWEKYKSNPVFQPDPRNEWEKERVTASQVIPGNGWFYMFYIGFQDINTARIGLARSRDGILNWERHKNNPIIDHGTKGDWDANAAYKPFAIYDGQRWLLWYNGSNGKAEQIGLATHEGEDLGF